MISMWYQDTANKQNSFCSLQPSPKERNWKDGGPRSGENESLAIRIRSLEKGAGRRTSLITSFDLT